MFMVRIHVPIMQTATLANETVLYEDSPLKGLGVFYLPCYIYTPQKAGGPWEKLFQPKPSATRNYFQLFMIHEEAV